MARSHGEPAERDFTVNLREAKQLTRFSQFRRPSTNGHDNGFRRYVVTDTSPDGLMAQDQHGYSVRVDFAHPDKAFLKTLERVDGPLSFEWILNRDVPTIREHVQAWARQGVCAPVEIYYRHGAIAGQSIACNHRCGVAFREAKALVNGGAVLRVCLAKSKTTGKPVRFATFAGDQLTVDCDSVTAKDSKRTFRLSSNWSTETCMEKLVQALRTGEAYGY